MKFQEFFEKNRKLLKLNFVLLGTLIFFLGLQGLNVCYAATETEITNSGMTVAEWTEDVLTHYGILDKNLPYVVYKDQYSNLKIHVFTDLTSDYILKPEYATSLRGIGLNFTLNSLAPIDLLLETSNDGLNVWVLDMVNDSYSIVKNFVFADSRYNKSYPLGQLSGNYQSLDGGIRNIIYTNFSKMWYVSGDTTEFRDLDKELVIFDYNDYISYLSDDLGVYIKLDAGLKDTDVSTIVFEGSNLMNNKTSYTLSTLVNFDLAKVYVNDSEEVKISFKDTVGNLLYSITKYYNASNENDEELFELFDYDFDVSNSEVGEFDGIWYYKDIDFYIKYNNIYNYYNDNNYGDIVYFPVISFDAIFNNGEVINGSKYYFAFDETYHLSLPGPLLCQNIMSSGDEGGLANLFFPIGMYNFGVDIGEMISNGNLYSLRINMSVDKLQIDDVGNYIYLSTVHNRSVVQNFSTKQNVSIGTVVELQDSDGNDIGFVVVDGNGTIISNSLNEGYTTDNNYVYDSSNNIVYTFNSNDNGWGLSDKDGNVIKEHDNVTIEDKVQYANDNSFSGNFADTINTIASTITGSLSALLTSVTGIATLFGSAFSWLPEPIPQLVVFVFSAMAIFALIRFIRGH